MSYGDGSDVVGFRTTPDIKKLAPSMGVTGYLDSKLMLDDYETYAGWRNVWITDSAARRPTPASPSAAAIWREKVGADIFPGPWNQGWAGVDLFFVLSGFIMVWVTQQDGSQGARSALQFGWKRLTRIYPIWWVFCALMAAYFLVTYQQPAPPPGDSPWLRFWQSMALWPQGSLPVLSVGWTLTFEIAFYAVFAFLILVPNRFRLALMLIWGGVIIAVWGTGHAPQIWPSTWGGILLSPICLEFILGALVASVVLSGQCPRFISRSLLALGGLIFVWRLVSGVAPDASFGLLVGYSRILDFGLPAGLIVFGLAAEEGRSGVRVPKLLKDLGDASYSLYLMHLLLLLALIRMVGWVIDIPATALSFTMFAGVGTLLCLVASLVIYRVLERPLIRLSRFPLVKREAERQG